MRALAILISCAIACGRGHFDIISMSDGALDATVDTAPDGPPPVLACAGSRFSIGAATGMRLSATATPSGYDVFTVDPDAGQVRGYTYNFTGNVLAIGADQVPITTHDEPATGPLAALAVGDDVLLVMPLGRPLPTTTSLITLDGHLGHNTVAMYPGLAAASGALTRDASGKIALITQHIATGAANDDEVEAKLISPDGTDLLGPYPVLNGSESASDATIVPAKTGFLVSWIAGTQVHAELLNSQLVISTPELLISPTTNGGGSPRAAYLASADRYLFVWHAKPLTGGNDQIWGSLRDADFTEIGGGPFLISDAGVGLFPVVVAGSDDFLVAWQDGQNNDDYHLGAARVTKDGNVVQPGIRSTGASAVAWDLAVRYGQPALVWIETDGADFKLRLDPVCP